MMNYYYYCSNNPKLMKLPSEIVVDILLRLPVKSVCCIRCVCKSLLNIVDSPTFVTMHARGLLSAQVVPPQLMLITKSFNSTSRNLLLTSQSLKYDDSSSTFSKSNHAIVSEIAVHHHTLHFVFCNLFCFSGIANQVRPFLFNPLKGGQVMVLPTTSDVQVPDHSNLHYGNCDWYGMGFDNITTTYKIVRVTENARKCLVAQLLVLGTTSWRQIPSVPPCHLSINNVYAYGDMHWLVRGYGIISFDFKKEEFLCWSPHLTVPVAVPVPRQAHRAAFLLNLRGSLAITTVNITSVGLDMYIEIWVLKDYGKKDYWMLDRTIDVGMDVNPRCRSGVSKFSSCGEWEHGIYFTNEIDGTAFFLDLRFGSVNHLHCPSLSKSHEFWKTIRSYTGSLISLQHFGNLVEAQTGNWEPNCPRQLWQLVQAPGTDPLYYGNLVEGEACN